MQEEKEIVLDTRPDRDSRLELLFIRHGMTEGNRQHRYIGSGTDEGLCPEGRAALSGFSYPMPELLFASPMKRCLETAEIQFPGKEIRIVPELRESDFGLFENKNHEELSEDPLYQAWIDSGGQMAFPGGESREETRDRILRGFRRTLAACLREKIRYAAFVVHGGIIMNLMDAYGLPKKSFYDWQVKNGEGIRAYLQ